MAKTFCVHFFLSFLCAISRPVGRGGGKFGCWRLAVAFGCCVWRLVFGLWPLAHTLCLCFCLYLCLCLCPLLFSLWLYVFCFFPSVFFVLLLSSFFFFPHSSFFCLHLSASFVFPSLFVFPFSSSFVLFIHSFFFFYYPYLALTLSLTVTPNITLTITPTLTLSTPDFFNPQVQVTRDKVLHNGDFKNPVLREGEQGRESRKSKSTGEVRLG